MASLSSTKTSLFASESHLLTGVHVTSYLNLFAVKFLILTFFRLENHFSIITLFFSFLIIISFFLNFRLCSVNNLIFPTCHHLPIPISGPCQKFLFHRISILHFLAIIFGCSTFWLTLHVPPSTNIVIKVIHWKWCKKFKSENKNNIHIYTTQNLSR